MQIEDSVEMETARGATQKLPRYTDTRTPSNGHDDIPLVKKKIRGVRSKPFHHAFQKDADVADLVITSFSKRGEFFWDSVRRFVFLRDERALLPLEETDEGLELALNDYGLNPTEKITSYVIDSLRLHAKNRGRETEVHAFAHYSRSKNAAYIYDFAGGVYRITPGGIEHCDNGVDGVLFLQKPHWRRLELTFDQSGKAHEWREWLLSGVQFTPGALTEDDQRVLFVLWTLTLFFPELFPTRIVLALVGEKGSGKTSLLRRIGRLLFGSKFDVSALTSKSDDFDAAITTDPFVVADNADEAPAWFADRLAVVATGGTIKRRILYTTNRLGEFPIVATVALTTRTPNFTREDVAERLLPLNVKGLAKYRSEAALQAEIAQRRHEVVSGIVADVWRAICLLDEQRDKSYETTFRMADFADFALKVAPVVAERAEVEAILRKLGQQQVAFSTENEMILPLLDEWLLDDAEHVNREREIVVADLQRELEAIAGDRQVPWISQNSRSFSQYWMNRKGTLVKLYGMTERRGHAGSLFVTLRHGRTGDFGDFGRRDSPAVYEDIETAGEEEA